MKDWIPTSFDKWMHWDALRKFGTSRLVQSTIVVPVVGYVILFNAELSQYFALIIDANDNSTPPGRLYWLYFGFCFLAIGSIIFGVRCPREVKEHGSAYDFVSKQNFIMHDVRLKGMRDKLLRRAYSQLCANTNYEFEIVSEPSRLVGGEEDHSLLDIRRSFRSYANDLDNVDRDGVMRDYFELLEEDRPWSRRAAFVMYVIGGALISVPTVHTFVLVSMTLI